MHKEFAEIYDIFMKYVNYDGWYKFLRTFIKKKGTVLDLGCGTGEFIWRFLKDGFSVIGVDLSEKMLEISEKKLKEKNLKNNNYSLINENIINYENKINFDENGKFYSTVYYEKNSNLTKWQFFYEDEKSIKKEGMAYDMGEEAKKRWIATGEWKYYSKAGKLQKIETYENGEIIKVEKFK